MRQLTLSLVLALLVAPATFGQLSGTPGAQPIPGGGSTAAPPPRPPDPPPLPGWARIAGNTNLEDTGKGHGSGGVRGAQKGNPRGRGGAVMPRPGARPGGGGGGGPGGGGAGGGPRGKPKGAGKGHGLGAGAARGRGTTMTPKQAAAHLPWEVWWVLNHERFVDVRRSATRKAASRSRDDSLGGLEDPDVVITADRDKILAKALPVLKLALRDENALVRQGAAVAIGRLATPEMGEVIEALEPLLEDESDLVRASACLGMGLTGHPSAVPMLVEIMADSPKGRQLIGAATVSVRLRAYAALSLGLIAARDPGAVSGPAISQLVQTAIKPHPVADLQLAPLVALQFLEEGTVRSALRLVLKSEEHIGEARAQAALALGKIGATEAIPDLRLMLGADETHVVRSSVIALGVLTGADDEHTREAVIELAGHHPDRSVRNFALLALGEIGGAEARDFLLKRLEKGPLLDRTWSTMALGVMGFKKTTDMDGVGDHLLGRYKTVRSISEKSAFAIALGLLRHEPAARTLAVEVRTRRSPELRGNLAISLGLLGHRDARNDLRRLLAKPRDDGLTRHAALALGMLQDGAAVDVLTDLLKRKRISAAVVAGAARALGDLGDVRGVDALTQLAGDTTARNVARAYATAALGIIGDKDRPDPLFSRLRRHTNSLALTGVIYEFAHLF